MSKERSGSSLIRRFLRLLTLSLMMLVTLALPYPSQTTRAQTGWKTLFADDFEDGSANNWQLDRG